MTVLKSIREFLTRAFSDSVHPANKKVEEIFKEVVKGQPIERLTRFNDLKTNPKMEMLLSAKLRNCLQDIPQDWRSLTVKKLEALDRRSTAFTFCETNLILRALAIMAVVSGHTHFFVFAGGASFLFALTGYNFRRFKFFSFLRDNSPWPSIWRYEKKILIPYFVAILSYFAWKGVFEPDVLFLYSNFLRIHGTAIFPIWFVEVLAQCVLIIGLLFWSGSVRNFAQQNMILFSIIVLCLIVATKFAISIVWNTEYLLDRVPHHYFAIVWLGWCAASVRNLAEKITVTILIALVALWYGPSTTSIWIIVGLSSIMWAPFVILPSALSIATFYIASASYYIFLTHMATAHILREGLNVEAPYLLFVAGIAGGVAAWMVFDKFEAHRRLLRVWKLQRNRAA